MDQVLSLGCVFGHLWNFLKLQMLSMAYVEGVYKNVSREFFSTCMIAGHGNSASWKQLLSSLTMRIDRISLKQMVCVYRMNVVHIVPSLFPFLLWFLGSSSIFVDLK